MIDRKANSQYGGLRSIVGRATKTGRLREKMLAEVKYSKQSTFDSLPNASPHKESAPTLEPKQEKRITITDITHTIREDELALRVSFKLSPSKSSFSKVWSELFFEDQKISSASVTIPQGLLATNDFELTPVLDMRGISAGSYDVRVEMFERWDLGEVLTSASKEIRLAYIPVSRQQRLIKVPTVKSIAGTDLLVVSEDEKDIYHDIEQDMKKELSSKRDQW